MTEPTIKQVVVRHYGLGEPFDWDDDCLEILWRQNKLWNQLVELERAHQAQFQSISSASPAIQTLQAKLDALGEHKDAIRRERALLRKGQGRKKIDTQLLEERMRQDKRAIKDLGAQLRDKRKALRQKRRPGLEIEAIKLGSQLTKVKHTTTQSCHQCGHRVRLANRAELHQHCDQCGAVWDQDVNAAINLVGVESRRD